MDPPDARDDGVQGRSPTRGGESAQMIAAWLIVAIGLISVVFGYLVSRAKPGDIQLDLPVLTPFANALGGGGGVSATFSVPAILLAAVAAAVAAVVAVVLVSRVWPAWDDSRFDATSAITIATSRGASAPLPPSCRIDGASGKPTVVCREPADKAAEQAHPLSAVAIAYPPAVRQRDDFAIVFEYAADAAARPGEVSATLTAPNSLEARTTQACKADASAGVVKACVTAKPPPRPVRFVWTVTPKETGRALIGLATPLIAPPPPGGDRSLITMVQRSDEADRLASSESFARLGHVVVDLQNQSLSFPVEVLTTLGVTQRTYDLFAVLAAVVGALGTLLGSGFLAKLISRKAKPDGGEG